MVIVNKEHVTGRQLGLVDEDAEIRTGVGLDPKPGFSAVVRVEHDAFERSGLFVSFDLSRKLGIAVDVANDTVDAFHRLSPTGA